MTTNREVAGDCQKQAVAGRFRCAESLLLAIEARHDGIADAFGTGSGLRPQRVDSDMAAYVSRRALESGILALPVHDEFVAAKGREADRIKELMDEA